LNNDRASDLDAASIGSTGGMILHILYIDMGNLEQSRYIHHLLTSDCQLETAACHFASLQNRRFADEHYPVHDSQYSTQTRRVVQRLRQF
jgi:hypothetical protein